MLARIAIRRGDLDAASAYLATGIARLTSGGSLFGADWLLDAQTQYLAATGDLEAALNVAELTWSQTESLRFFYGYRERGIVAIRLAMACGRTDFANTVADSLEEGSRRCPTASGQAFALQARGLVDGDADLLVDAVAQFRDTPLVIALASCCEDAAAALADAGRNDEAIALLDRGARDPRRGRSVRQTSSASRRRCAASERDRDRRGRCARRFGWESLTPTELAVSELVASGLTNPEIGSPPLRVPPHRRNPPRPRLPQARLRQPHPTRLRVHPPHCRQVLARVQANRGRSWRPVGVAAGERDQSGELVRVGGDRALVVVALRHSQGCHVAFEVVGENHRHDFRIEVRVDRCPAGDVPCVHERVAAHERHVRIDGHVADS